MLDAEKIRKDFPILSRTVNGLPLIYLDSAATSQKPRSVIEAIEDYYQRINANVLRGVHTLSVEATEAYETARRKTADFIGARDTAEVIFTRNTTESVNLVAYAWGRKYVQEGDEILLTEMEHHSNLVPWQILAREKRAVLRYARVTPEGELDLDHFKSLLTSRTKIVAMTLGSNVLGTLPPVTELAPLVHEWGAVLLVDGAQAVPHQAVDVQRLGADFLAFSGHKMLGPMGIGVLWGRRELLEAMDPFLGGGEMILNVEWQTSTWNELPYKFEAGTSNIEGAIGLGAAIDYLRGLGMDQIREHEMAITDYALKKIGGVPGTTIYGPRDPQRRGGLVAFNLQGIHAHDLGTLLDQEGIAIRTGHHCAQPLTKKLGVTATARSSFYVYNTFSEVDELVRTLEKARRYFHAG